MPAEPPRHLEAIVSAILPPASREEVLGDLREQCSSTGQYVALAMQVVPCVILSRIRRTTDLLILLTEALLLYGSLLAGTWYTNRALLTSRRGLLWLALPVTLTVVFLMLDRAWGRKSGALMWIFRGVVLAIGMYANALGSFCGLLLVLALEMMSRSGEDRPQLAAGPAPIRPAALSGNAKSLLAAVTLVAVSAAALLSFGAKPGMLGIVVVLAVFGSRFFKSGKE
jgi:hypothetical protein